MGLCFGCPPISCISENLSGELATKIGAICIRNRRTLVRMVPRMLGSPEVLGPAAAASMCAGGAFEGGGLVTAQGASSQSFSGGCSELEYEELLLAEAEVLASCGPELINRMWARVIEKEFARSSVFKFEKKCDLTAMDLSVLVVEDQPFQQQAINALLQIYSMRNPSCTFRTKIVDSAVSAMSVLQRRRDFHMVRRRLAPFLTPQVSPCAPALRHGGWAKGAATCERTR